jgi:hypothetical protein
LSPVDALAALLESSILVVARLPGHRAQLQALAALADRAPARRVELGADLLADPAGVAARIAAG